MYDSDEDGLFGRDMRHKPPRADLMTARGGWGGSHGRLAYSGMNRQQDSNMSKYAISTIGMLPKGYVIVNAKTMNYDPDTALKVGHHRVAVPVKELARERRFTLYEQWELMNPRFVGTFFVASNAFKSKRMNFDEAYQDAIAKGKSDEFISMFWAPEQENEHAISRLRRSLCELEEKRMFAKLKMMRAEGAARKVKTDLYFQRIHLYENIQYALLLAEDKAEKTTKAYNEIVEKIEKIKTFLKNYTFKRG